MADFYAEKSDWKIALIDAWGEAKFDNDTAPPLQKKATFHFRKEGKGRWVADAEIDGKTMYRWAAARNRLVILDYIEDIYGLAMLADDGMSVTANL